VELPHELERDVAVLDEDNVAVLDADGVALLEPVFIFLTTCLEVLIYHFLQT
jgi:hypothetical protein